jgi:hypothetical protein
VRLALIVLVAVGVTVGLFELLSLSSADDAKFLAMERSRIWELALVFQNALWAGVAAFLWGSWRRLRSTYGVDEGVTRRIVLWTLCVVALAGAGAAFSLGRVPDYALKDDHAFRIASAVFGLCVLAIATATMALAGATARRVLGAPPARQLQLYLALRANLHDVLNATAAVIGMLIIVSAALRGAVLAAGVPAAKFPSDYIIYFGASYSALLAFAYAPAYRAFRDVGTVLRDRLHPLPAVAAESWASWCGDRKALEALLELDVVGTKSIKTGLALATPLIVSAAGVLIGVGK